jgi:protein tyrosine phosphatase (PTP) superfamily phosphohydrolase (DUF442 family)
MRLALSLALAGCLTPAVALARPAQIPAAPEPVASAPAPPALLNAREPLPGVRTGGVPADPAIWTQLAAEGVRLVVDLRGANDPVGDAPQAAAAAGLTYVSIPVTGEADLDLAAARRLDAALDAADRVPAAVVCSSGNRSGALLAVRAFWLDRVSAEEALALGQKAGLTRLEPSVRTLLGLPPAEPTPNPN